MNVHSFHLTSGLPLSKPMAFTTGFRLLCRYHHRLTLPARVPPFPGLRRGASELRFLSAAVPQRRRVRPVSATRGEVEAADGGDTVNGSVIVSDGGGIGSGGGEGRIVATELHKEATDAYMSYAMSVLLGRALPDVRDGLKPVHRRILFAMHELGLSSKKPYKKCARVVGEVLGKFHPHRDNAVYDSLVRMAQQQNSDAMKVLSHFTSTFRLIQHKPGRRKRKMLLF